MFKSISSYFSLILPLYFIFAHPAIIYYNTVSYDHMGSRSGKVALLYLVISILLWSSVFIMAFYNLYKFSFQAQRNIHAITTQGQKITAKIIESRPSKINFKNFEQRSIVLEFNNFQNVTVWHKMIINDSKPKEKRYEEGNILTLKVDSTFTKHPYLFIDGVQTRINVNLYAICVFSVIAVVAYYIFSYNLENRTYGWRFLRIEHPLILIPLIISFFALLLWFISRKFKNTSLNKESLQLKLQGYKAIAKVLDASQTGFSINDQPEVKFELEYVDLNEKVHQVTLKKIVPLIKLSSIHNTEAEIFYLPNQPENIAFTDDLNSII